MVYFKDFPMNFCAQIVEGVSGLRVPVPKEDDVLQRCLRCAALVKALLR